MRVVARAAEEKSEAPAPAAAANVEDVEAPLAIPLLDVHRDGASDELARCCFARGRAARGGVGPVDLQPRALADFIGASRSDRALRRPPAVDGLGRRDGCHHPQGQEPCAVAAIYTNGVPFLIAFVGAVPGCCGVCCRIPKKADPNWPTAGASP